MNLNNIKVRTFATKSIGTLEADGKWKLITGLYETVSEDGINFEERKVESMSIDKDFQGAFDTALLSALRLYADKTNGAGSLFEVSEDTNDKIRLDLPSSSKSDSN